MIINPYSFGVSYDADAQAFFTAESNAGVTLSNTEKTAINTLVVNCKSANIWTKMKAIYPLVNSTATAQKFNLKNPADTNAAYRLLWSGGWVHSSNGAQTNANNSYAFTYLIPNTNLTLRNTHISIYIRNNTAAGNLADMGCGNATTANPSMFLASKYGSTNALSDAYNNTSNRISVTNNDSRGFYISSRTSINSHKLYKNGSSIGTDTNNEANALMPNVALTFGGYNFGGSVVQITDKQFAFVSIGDGLTDTEAANFYTAVQNFQTTLGRQV